MSRREARDSHGKRWESRSERDTSPKRLRRDGNDETELEHPENGSKVTDQTDGDRTYPSRSKDASPVQANAPSELREKSDSANKEQKKSDSYDETDPPRSRLHFQRGGEERSDSRGYNRRGSESRAYWDDSRDRFRDNRASEFQRRDRNPNRPDDRIWKHDRFHEVEAGGAPPARRPAFREIKASVGGGPTNPVELPRRDRPGYGTTRADDRGYSRGHEMQGNSFTGADDQVWREDRQSLPWREARRPSFHQRERFYAGGAPGWRDRERWSDGNRQPEFSGQQAEKWKHDLFDDGNRSPAAKNEEDEIAKLEALLSS